MRRHWVIRCLFLLPAILFFQLWWISYVRYAWIERDSSTANWSLLSERGELSVCYAPWAPFPHVGRGWVFGGSGPHNDLIGLLTGPAVRTPAWRFLGFTWIQDPSVWLGGVPWWFVFLVSGLFGIWGWRRVGRRSPAMAFPVEMDEVQGGRPIQGRSPGSQ